MEMRVTGRIECEDYVQVMAYLNTRLMRAFQKQSRTPGALLRILGILLCFAIATVALLLLAAVILGDSFFAAWQPDIISILLTLATFFFVLFLQRRNIFRYMGQQLRENGYVLQEHAFIITGDAFVIEARQSYSRIEWPCIAAVEHVKDMIYIFIEQTLAYYIPTRFFASTEECDAYLTALQERIGQQFALTEH